MYNIDISVVMPVYNDEKYVGEAIESILNQTYRNFEFIIINDGSTDNSLNIIRSYAEKDDRIIVVSRKNRGLVFSLNEGIGLSRGKYIARMDSDDISDKTRFEKQINYIKSNSVDILGTYAETFGVAEKEKERIFNIYINSGNSEEIFLKYCLICHSSIMMKKEVIENLNGYDESFLSGEDYDLWLRALKSGYKIEKIEEQLVKVRCHDDSKTKLDAEYGILKDHMRARLNYLKDIFNTKNSFALWGAGAGGRIALKKLKDEFENVKSFCYIDKFKTGIIDGEKVYKPEEVGDINLEYIFITTQVGRQEVEEYLVSKGLKPVKDFVCLV
ncbi:glycosyltransferase family 2 protein [Clostridium felsineum]|uniref:glycosyltransferase family 2 protein n=1 Tax=Clostridium felsineum TaxID=36839 RepID=UPI0009CDA4BC|nr:glycosyltransferase [Clostridium felsineum]URZ00946.1 Undecaprenyl-phosphate 4-deoxy-4-formamido-L-arabinose transferase [Clostridium felsineum]